MFWRFGGYANISTIDTILDKPDFTLEELLDESDLIQELKQHNSKLIEYLREDTILERLLEYVVAPKLETVESAEEHIEEDPRARSRLLPFTRPRASSRTTDVTDNDEDEQEKRRNRYALVACEILSSDTWSIYEALAENRDLIRKFWTFLSRPAPLDPLQASYFTKVNESLFEKKTEEMMELLQNIPDVVADFLKHVECPMVMDLLLKIIALDRNEGGHGVVEWLFSKNVIPTLLSCLGPEHSWVVQTAAGDFIKAIITISANASQNEQQCIGPNELTRQLVSKECVEQLIGYMLGGGNPLIVGVGIVIEVIRKNNSDYDPDVGSGPQVVPSSRDPIYLGTLLRLFADNVPQFMSLVMDVPGQKDGVSSTFGDRLRPLGFDRFKTCELMAELLHCSNMGLLNEPGSEQLISTRDTERQRLRSEGKLGPHREEEHSDDLTMRMPHSASDEGRRLEVTNADDDGFEEVESSKEMSEDTSHEFVKAEEDIAEQPPLSSFLEKDEDDFVDEPLSSPRLSVGADKLSEQQFDEPDLVVAPLSPTKPKPAELATDDATLSSAATGSAETGNSKNTSETSSETANANATGSAAVSHSHTAAPEIKIDSKELSPPETARDGLSPHPEDTPAPLFSVPVAAEDASATTSGQSEGASSQNDGAADNTTSANAAEQSDLGAEGATGKPRDVTESVDPVVGDYLKMQFVEHGVVPAILNFFFSYPWNNFLHNVVYDIVQQVFNGPMDRGYNPTLAVSLFEAADITATIIQGQQASDVSQAKTKTRMGYMGHLTLIAEEVVKFTERHPPELLSEQVLDKVMSQDWINYVEGALAETRERDNAILGGVRPDMAMGHRASIGGNDLGGVGLSGLGGNSSMGASSALAEAGLNGGIELSDGGGNGIGPFTISAGTLMSGFGSSSDEEDEEGEGDEEDANSELRSYNDPLNNTGGSMEPPSIPPPPPPPPPLNIPPSRARLQLAARLAMHQKSSQARQATASGQDDGDDYEDNSIDPFADDEDADDVDEEEVGEEIPATLGRGAWWRGVIGAKDQGGGSGHDSEDDEEFGDFAMAEEDKGGAGGDGSDKTFIKAVPASAAKETTRVLSGLWPFGSRSDGKDRAREAAGAGEEDADLGFDKSLPEAKEAKKRTSIEGPDDDDDNDNDATAEGPAR